jgi:hypothetical protein
MLQVLRYEDSLEKLIGDPRPIVFLAGPTVRGHQPHLTSWRFEAIEEFREQAFEGILIVPEFTSKTESDKGKLWVPAWEFAGLCASDVNLFWIPRTKELIGLTTNHEHGYWLGAKARKMVYGRPEDSYRNTYLDLMWDFDAEQQGRPKEPIFKTMVELVEAAIAKAILQHKENRYASVIPVISPYGEFAVHR